MPSTSSASRLKSTVPVLVLLYRLLLGVKERMEIQELLPFSVMGQWAEPELLVLRMLVSKSIEMSGPTRQVSLLARCQWKRLAGFLSWPFLSDSWQEAHNAVTIELVPGEAAHLKAVLYLTIISHHWPVFCQHHRSFFLWRKYLLCLL